MLTNTKDDFKAFFLLEFTRQLIKNSSKNDFIELETILKKEEKPTRQEITEKIKKREIVIKKEIKKPILIQRKKPKLSVLKIPETRLPLNLQYLKPTPTKLEIDLGKLNPLIQDPLVTSIECSGASEQIIVRGKMGMKKTNIVLNKEEIDEVINKFSEAAKIPVHEGILKMAKGRLVLSAIISKIIGSKFILKKMAYRQHPVINQNAR